MKMHSTAQTITGIPEFPRLARLITAVHRQPKQCDVLLMQEWIPQGRAHTIGITGSTAIGKSTFINQIVRVLRDDGKTVIVLAIDPTETRTGGAILGDTIRMRDHYLDPGVFMRSFGSRGARSALTRSLRVILRVASRFADIVIVETAGAGQGDTTIRRYVDTLVVLPESRGDLVNLMKAGPHQFAHLLAVNLRTPEDERFLFLAQSFAETLEARKGWQPKAFGVNAKSGVGVAEFVHKGIYAHRDFLRVR